jgi:hypothetical protein
MSQKSRRTLRIILAVLSACLFLAIVSKFSFSVLGGYGGSAFAALDDISNVLFLPWLVALTLYLFSQGRRLFVR